MGRPTLLDRDQVKNAPYVVAMRDGHVIGATGNEIYAGGIGSAAADARYSIIHVDEKIYDPETRDLLGYSGMYVGSGPVATTGDPAKLLLTDSTREDAGRQAVRRIGRRERRLRAARALSRRGSPRDRRARPHGDGPVHSDRSESRPARRPRAGTRARDQPGRRRGARHLLERRPERYEQECHGRRRQGGAAAGRAHRSRDGVQGVRPHELRARDGNHARNSPGRFGEESLKK